MNTDIVTALLETERKLKAQGHQLPALVLLKKDGSKETYSWEDYLHYQAFNVALVLQELKFVNSSGPEKENFIAVIPANLPESFFALLGIIMAGGVPVPIHPMLLKEPGKVQEILNHCNPQLTLVSECLLNECKEIGHKTVTIEQMLALGKRINSNMMVKRFYRSDKIRNPDRLLIMPYTSGTTGGPKGVMLSHGNILDRVESTIELLKVSAEDRILSYLTLGHISELIATFFGQMIGGYTVYFTEYTDREELKKNFTSVLKRIRPTVFLGVPKVWINVETGIKQKIESARKLVRLLPMSFLKNKIRQEIGLDHTRISISSGSEINRRQINFFRKLKLIIVDVYGQTETAGPLLANGSIVGNTNRVFLDPFSKEILVAGKAVMLGYYNNPEANRKVFDEKGLYHTGDLGEMVYDSEPGPYKPKIAHRTRAGTGFKLANGEYITEQTIEKLQEEIGAAVNDIDPQAEVIICGEGKQHLVALIFLDENLAKKKGEKLKKTIIDKVKSIGRGLTKIKGVAILSKQKYLLLTPTMKPRREEIIKNLKEVIEKL